MQVFTPNEFSLILSGVPRIDVEDWQRNTEVTLTVILAWRGSINFIDPELIKYYSMTCNSSTIILLL